MATKREFCTTEKDGHLLIVTINRPERLNALHPGCSEEFEKVFDEFEADPELWVAIGWCVDPRPSRVGCRRRMLRVATKKPVRPKGLERTRHSVPPPESRPGFPDSGNAGPYQPRFGRAGVSRCVDPSVRSHFGSRLRRGVRMIS